MNRHIDGHLIRKINSKLASNDGFSLSCFHASIFQCRESKSVGVSRLYTANSQNLCFLRAFFGQRKGTKSTKSSGHNLCARRFFALQNQASHGLVTALLPQALRSSALILRASIVPFVLCLIVLLVGCSDVSEDDNRATEEPPVRQSARVEVQPTDEQSVAEVRKQLKAKNPGFGQGGEFQKAAGKIKFANLAGTKLVDISPLKGLPLKFLDLSETAVSDISAVTGMPLEQIFLESTKVTDISALKGMEPEVVWLKNTEVADISPLSGMNLKQLMLFGTKVTDISTVSTMTIGTLWLVGTDVSDLSPLAGKSLVSLDVQDTKVADLSVLAEMTSLRRLNIAGSEVTDVTPLKNLQLDRLILTPHRIKAGVDVIRKMKSLKALDVSFDGNKKPSSPTEFWKKYDGKFAATTD